MPFTAHTPDPVPFICVSPDVAELADGGILADVAPSVCALLGIAPRPSGPAPRCYGVRGLICHLSCTVPHGYTGTACVD